MVTQFPLKVIHQSNENLRAARILSPKSTSFCISAVFPSCWNLIANTQTSLIVCVIKKGSYFLLIRDREAPLNLIGVGERPKWWGRAASCTIALHI